MATYDPYLSNQFKSSTLFAYIRGLTPACMIADRICNGNFYVVKLSLTRGMFLRVAMFF